MTNNSPKITIAPRTQGFVNGYNIKVDGVMVGEAWQGQYWHARFSDGSRLAKKSLTLLRVAVKRDIERRLSPLAAY